MMLVSEKLFEDVRKKITDKVDRFQRENPLLPGISREDFAPAWVKRVRSETFRAARRIGGTKKIGRAGANW